MKVSKKERTSMKHDELLRAVWLLDDWIEMHDWVPVSERLPDDIVNPITQDAYVYPVTVDLGGVTDVRYYSFCRGHWHNQSPKVMDDYVLAWMPRPEPYIPKGESSEQKRND